MPKRPTITSMEHEWSAATLRLDEPALRRIVADDYVGIESDGTMTDKQAYLEATLTGKERVTLERVSELRVRRYGAVAIATGRLEIQGTRGSIPFHLDLLITDVWVQRAGHWQVVSYHATRRTP